MRKTGTGFTVQLTNCHNNENQKKSPFVDFLRFSRVVPLGFSLASSIRNK